MTVLHFKFLNNSICTWSILKKEYLMKYEIFLYYEYRTFGGAIVCTMITIFSFRSEQYFYYFFKKYSVEIFTWENHSICGVAEEKKCWILNSDGMKYSIKYDFYSVKPYKLSKKHLSKYKIEQKVSEIRNWIWDFFDLHPKDPRFDSCFKALFARFWIFSI